LEASEKKRPEEGTRGVLEKISDFPPQKHAKSEGPSIYVCNHRKGSEEEGGLLQRVEGAMAVSWVVALRFFP